MSVQTTSTGDNGSNWLCLSVQDFFNTLNWQGTPQSPETNGHRPDSVKSLSQSVNEFFQAFIWEGTPAVGQLPSHSSTPPAQNPPEEEDVTIDDLMNLF